MRPMSLPDSLRAVARGLLTIDPTRPRQASLRRAVSTAYYALFHLLVDAAVRRVCGSDLAARGAASRGFTHTGVAELADLALRPPAGRPERLRAVLGSSSLSPELRVVCQTINDAHAEREAADYDLTKSYRRSTVSLLLAQTDQAFAAWQTVRRTEEGRRFVAALILHARGRAR